jgi:predicted amidophosphoribosyltransferase
VVLQTYVLETEYEPMGSNCGHSLCRGCWGLLPKDPKEICPICRAEVATRTVRIFAYICKLDLIGKMYVVCR